MADISREELDRFYDTLRDGFAGVHNRLDVLNGRTRLTEQKIAVLEDRGLDRKSQAAVGVGASAAIVAVYEAVKAFVIK